MKTLIKRTHFAIYILLTAVLFAACNDIVEIENTTVTKITTSYIDNDYKYWITTSDGVEIYTNTNYMIGDTLKFKHYR